MSDHNVETTGEVSLTNAQFWSLYLAEHQQLANCWLHVLGTIASWLVIAVAIAVAIVWQWWWLLILVPLVGYGPAWLGHLFVEGNRPLSIRYPVRSLMADYRLTWQMLTGGRRGGVTSELRVNADDDVQSSNANREPDA